MELKRVVVTGLGALTPLGKNVDEYWENLVNGVSGADMITQFDASKFRTRFAWHSRNCKCFCHNTLQYNYGETFIREHLSEMITC